MGKALSCKDASSPTVATSVSFFLFHLVAVKTAHLGEVWCHTKGDCRLAPLYILWGRMVDLDLWAMLVLVNYVIPFEVNVPSFEIRRLVRLQFWLGLHGEGRGRDVEGGCCFMSFSFQL